MSSEIRMPSATQLDSCPFLVPVIADRAWIYPAATTLARVCTTPGHLECAGYRANAHPAGD